MKISHTLQALNIPARIIEKLRAAENADTVIDFSKSPLLFSDEKITKERLDGMDYEWIENAEGPATVIVNSSPAGKIVDLLELDVKLYSNSPIVTWGVPGI